MKNKVIERIFLSYVLIVVIVLGIMGTFVTGYLFSQTNSQIEALTVNVLNRTSEAVDAELRGINSLAYQISVSSAVMDFATTQYTNRGEKSFYAKRVCGELGTSNMFISLFDNIGVFFTKNNCIVDFYTIYTPEEFFSEYFYQSNVSFDQWYNSILKSSKIRFIPAMEITRNTDNNISVLTYIQPLFGAGDEQAILIGMIRSDTLLKYFNTAFEETMGSFAVLDLDGRVVAATESMPDVDFESLLRQEEEYSEIKTEGEKYISVVGKSKVLGLFYTYLMPKKQVLKDAYVVRRVFVVVFIFVFLLSIYVIFRNTKRKLLPIQNMTNRIREKFESANVDSLDKLDMFMGNVLDENEQLNRVVYMQLEAVKKRFLSRLIWDSQLIAENEIEENKRNFNINLPYDKYCALVIDFADSGLFQTSEGTVDEYQIMEIVRIAAKHIVAENIPVERDAIVYMLNGNEEDIEKFIKKLYSIAESEMGLQIVVAYGCMVSGIRQFSKTYEEAAAAQTYAKRKGIYGIIRYQDIDSGVKKEMYYPPEKETALISAAKAGNTTVLKSILDEIYERNFTDDERARDESRSLIYSIVSTGIRIVNEISIGGDTQKHEFLNICRVVVRDHDMKRAYNNFAEKLLELCALTEKWQSNNVRNRGQITEEKIRNYINEHYADKDISLMKVSEELNYSYKYTSNIFKELFGRKFTDYINLLRLERAKELLLNSNLSVVQIADEVGYLSDATFIKNFKKSYGITPMNFRETQNKN